VLAAVGFSAVVCTWWAVRQAKNGRDVDLNRSIAGYTWRWTLWTVALEIVTGFAVLLLLPAEVLSGFMRGGFASLAPFSLAILLALGLLFMLSRAREPLAEGGIVTGVTGAMVLTIAFMTMTRHSVRLLYLAPALAGSELVVAAQWGNFTLFAVLLALGLATVGYMLRRVFTGSATGHEAA
jgi:hypothetical protein